MTDFKPSFTKDDMVVLGPNGAPITHLNYSLAVRQKLSAEGLEALKLSHQLRYMIFEAAKDVIAEPLKLQLLAKLFETLEFEQQELWGFGRDINFHRFFDFPGCKCPRLDNIDRLGVNGAVYAGDCPIHGTNK